MVAHAFTTNTWETEAGLLEFQDSRSYIERLFVIKQQHQHQQKKSVMVPFVLRGRRIVSLREA